VRSTFQDRLGPRNHFQDKDDTGLADRAASPAVARIETIRWLARPAASGPGAAPDQSLRQPRLSQMVTAVADVRGEDRAQRPGPDALHFAE